MTPTASRLKARLDERRGWFTHWLFLWHHIGGDRPVEIDMFGDRPAILNNVAFWGTPRDMFWDALVRGVRKEINTQLAWIDGEVRNYSRDTAQRAIDECAGQLAAFVSSVRRAAIKKDRILRGDGLNFPVENDAGHWEGTSYAEIRAHADALKMALRYPPPMPEPGTRERLLSAWNDNQWWLGPVGLIMGLAGLVLTFLI